MDMEHIQKMRLFVSQMQSMRDCQELIDIYTNRLKSEELSSEDEKLLNEKIEYQQSLLQVIENMYNMGTKKEKST
jgi:hypothetical protein